MADDFFLSRWSRRKTLARRGETPPEPKPADPRGAAAGIAPGTGAPQQQAATAVPAAPAEPPPLPPVESLTPDSDFTPFMRSEVDPNLRRQALRTLFQDPRFNVMDGLDVYIDDYSKPDPIPAEWMGRLNQMARLGHYKDPEAEAAEDAGDAEEAAAPVANAEEAPEGALAEASEVGAGTPSSDTGDASDRPTEVDDSSRSGGG
jgi:hypothetical protein